MHYLCLVYDEAATPRAPADDALLAEALAYSAELRQRGRALLAASLRPGAGAATVRLRGGEVVVEPGPDGEPCERPGELYLIRAADLSAAIMVAARLPAARRGRAEVWPIDLHGDA